MSLTYSELFKLKGEVLRTVLNSEPALMDTIGETLSTIAGARVRDTLNALASGARARPPAGAPRPRGQRDGARPPPRHPPAPEGRPRRLAAGGGGGRGGGGGGASPGRPRAPARPPP